MALARKAGAAAVLLLVLAFVAVSQSKSHTRQGDGGPAIKARIDGPSKLAFDSKGNLFIYEASDDLRPVIREISASTKKITTLLVGCEEGAWPPKPERDDCLSSPAELQMAGDGRLLVAEFLRNRVRTLDLRSRTFSLVAGNGTREPSGDGGLAIAAGLPEPGCATTSQQGNIFVCDWRNRVRRIDARTGIISTLAGSGKAGFGGDGGPALEAQFNFLNSIAVNSAGDLFIADDTSYRIRRVDAKTGIIDTIAGTGHGERFGTPFRGEFGPAIDARLDTPLHLMFDKDGYLLFLNGESRICRINLGSGTITTVAGRNQPGFDGDGGPATQAHIYASGMALDPGGNLFFADLEHNRIRRVDAATGIITTFAGNGLPIRGPHPPIL
jgi:hypothetical protein